MTAMDERIDIEPLEGITDAIKAAENWLAFAYAHRDYPESDRYQQAVEAGCEVLIAKLQALGKQEPL